VLHEPQRAKVALHPPITPRGHRSIIAGPETCGGSAVRRHTLGWSRISSSRSSCWRDRPAHLSEKPDTSPKADRGHATFLGMSRRAASIGSRGVCALAVLLGVGACVEGPTALDACPPTEPAGGPGGSAGERCSVEGLICSYGDAPSMCNRTIAVCRGGHFYLSVLICTGYATCPATPPENGSTCSFGSDRNPCAFPRGVVCWCVPGSFGPSGVQDPPAWSCNSPVLTADCPDVMPNLGAACSVEGADCDYGECGSGWHMRCSDGTWTHVPSDACP
jgi:hypothetical protein